MVKIKMLVERKMLTTPMRMMTLEMTLTILRKVHRLELMMILVTSVKVSRSLILKLNLTMNLHYHHLYLPLKSILFLPSHS